MFLAPLLDALVLYPQCVKPARVDYVQPPGVVPPYPVGDKRVWCSASASVIGNEVKRNKLATCQGRNTS